MLGGPGLRQLLAAALVAAPLFVACGPSVDTALKADIDRRVRDLPAPSQTFSAPSAPTPLPLAAGQYVQYRVKNRAKEDGFFTVKVIDELQGAWWLELVTESYAGKQITKLLVYLGDRTRLDAFDVRGMTIKDVKGQVTEVTSDALAGMTAAWRDTLAPLVISWQGLPQEDARVPAGIFPACYKGRTGPDWGPLQSASNTWAHPLVPVTGLVKAMAVDASAYMELVAWGERGARSEIP